MLLQGIEKFIQSLQARGIAVYLISGGFRRVGQLGRPGSSFFANSGAPRRTGNWGVVGPGPKYPEGPRGLWRATRATEPPPGRRAEPARARGPRRELMLPVAKYLGIPKERVYANRMQWQW
jgi:hypothetical protein